MSRLIALLTRGEGVQIEYKQTLSSAYRIARTLAAFANTSGGTLLIGIDDNGRTTGIKSEYREMQLIERATDLLIDPTLIVSYEVIRHEGHDVLLINVPESDEKPHTAQNERGERIIYVRQRDKSVPTQRLLTAGAAVDQKLVQSPTVRNLLQFLRKNDSITAARLAKLVNISDYRANKLLHELADQGLLLLVDHPRPARFSLRQ